MARARRARKKGTRRRATRKKTTRKRSTRRAAARRTRTRRPRRTARRRKTKGLGLTRKAQKQILTVAAIVVGILILIALLEGPQYVRVRWYGGEVGSNAVYGRVTSVAIGAFGRGAIYVKSFNTGKVYTFRVGRDTNYSPHRYPSPGENAKIYYIYDRGRGQLNATLVKIR